MSNVSGGKRDTGDETVILHPYSLPLVPGKGRGVSTGTTPKSADRDLVRDHRTRRRKSLPKHVHWSTKEKDAPFVVVFLRTGPPGSYFGLR